MKVGEEQRDLEESQDNQIEIAFGSEMQELSLLIQALNCSGKLRGIYRELSWGRFYTFWGGGKQCIFKEVTVTPFPKAPYLQEQFFPPLVAQQTH